MVLKSFAVLFLSFLFVGLASGKIFERCELARELKDIYNDPLERVAVWVCIAHHAAEYDTKHVSGTKKNGSRSYGIFQINDRHWCSNSGRIQGCGLPCSKFKDDKIEDDYACAQKIHAAYQRNHNNGFLAWPEYEGYCRGHKVREYTKDCFKN